MAIDLDYKDFFKEGDLVDLPDDKAFLWYEEKYTDPADGKVKFRTLVKATKKTNAAGETVFEYTAKTGDVRRVTAEVGTELVYYIKNPVAGGADIEKTITIDYGDPIFDDTSSKNIIARVLGSDLRSPKGDLNEIKDSIQQDVDLALFSQKGEFREFPNIGVGIDYFIDDDVEDYEIIDYVRKELDRAFKDTFKVSLDKNKKISIEKLV